MRPAARSVLSAAALSLLVGFATVGGVASAEAAPRQASNAKPSATKAASPSSQKAKAAPKPAAKAAPAAKPAAKAVPAAKPKAPSAATIGGCEAIVKPITGGIGTCVPKGHAKVGSANGRQSYPNIYVRTGLSVANTKYVAAHEYGHHIFYLGCGTACQAYLTKVNGSPYYAKGTGKGYTHSNVERAANAFARCNGYGSAPAYGFLSCKDMRTALAQR